MLKVRAPALLTSLPPHSEHGLLLADTPDSRHDLPPPSRGTRRSWGRAQEAPRERVRWRAGTTRPLIPAISPANPVAARKMSVLARGTLSIRPWV